MAETITLRPNANGTSNGGGYSGDSDYYLCVDEETIDNDSTYIGTGYQNTTYNHFKFSEMPDAESISNLTVYHYLKKTDSYTYAKHGLIVNGSGYVSGYVNPGSSYSAYSRSHDTNPNTGNPWTSDEINTEGYLQSYLRMEGGVRCTQVYVTITYEPLLKGNGILNWWFIKESIDKGKKYFKNRGLWLPEPLTI
jgi:hypothetical protein